MFESLTNILKRHFEITILTFIWIKFKYADTYPRKAHGIETKGHRDSQERRLHRPAQGAVTCSSGQIAGSREEIVTRSGSQVHQAAFSNDHAKSSWERRWPPLRWADSRVPVVLQNGAYIVSIRSWDEPTCRLSQDKGPDDSWVRSGSKPGQWFQATAP